jgi:preprotein translocase subunit SecA
LAEYAIKFSFPRPNLAPQATQRRVEPASASPPPASAVTNAAVRRTPADPNGSAGDASATGGKVGRNEPCPCGSGKKYKKCHGA